MVLEISLNGKSDTATRIKRRESYRKTREKLVKVYQEHGDKALHCTLVGSGRYFTGITPSGKQVEFEINQGYAERSRDCGCLKIEGNTVFTSGRLEKCFTYILEN